MDRKERTEEKVQELFRIPAAGDEGTDGEFMQILQRYIFGDLCYTGSLDNRMRELVTITVLTVLNTLPQLKAHLGACLNVGCTPVELREAIYQCAPFIGFPQDPQCHRRAQRGTHRRRDHPAPAQAGHCGRG